MWLLGGRVALEKATPRIHLLVVRQFLRSCCLIAPFISQRVWPSQKLLRVDLAYWAFWFSTQAFWASLVRPTTLGEFTHSIYIYIYKYTSIHSQTNIKNQSINLDY